MKNESSLNEKPFTDPVPYFRQGWLVLDKIYLSTAEGEFFFHYFYPLFEIRFVEYIWFVDT